MFLAEREVFECAEGEAPIGDEGHHPVALGFELGPAQGRDQPDRGAASDVRKRNNPDEVLGRPAIHSGAKQDDANAGEHDSGTGDDPARHVQPECWIAHHSREQQGDDDLERSVRRQDATEEW